MSESSPPQTAPKRENMLINLSFNLLLPILILRKGKDWFGSDLENWLEPQADDKALVGSIILLIAISFPVGYGAWDFVRRRKWNFLSILGALSALLTGGIGLIPQATVFMFAIKEAALPGILGILTVLTLRTRKPLIRLFLYNPEVIRVELVDQALEKRGTQGPFDQLMVKCTWLIALSFILSAVLNYILARAYVETEPSIDIDRFNREVSDMWLWSFIIISIPCMVVSAYAFWVLIKGIRELAGLALEDILAQSPPAREK
jgi:hypothetical protein